MSEINAQAAEPPPAADFTAPQASPMSQIGAQAADPDPPVAAVRAPEPSAVLSDPQTESVQPAANAGVPDDAENATQDYVSTVKAAWMGPLMPTTPAEMFPVLALGLVVAGLLFRIAIKIQAASRRRRIVFDRSEPDQEIDDRLKHKLRDEIQEWDELIHKLPPLPIAAVSDYSSSSPFGTDDEWPDNARGSDQSTDAIKKREQMLEQLRRDVERLMRSPKVA